MSLEGRRVSIGDSQAVLEVRGKPDWRRPAPPLKLAATTTDTPTGHSREGNCGMVDPWSARCHRYNSAA